MTLILIGWTGTRDSLTILRYGIKRPVVLMLVFGVQVLRLASRYLTTEATKQAGSAILTSALSSVDPLYVWALSNVFRQEKPPTTNRVRFVRLASVALIAATTIYSILR